MRWLLFVFVFALFGCSNASRVCQDVPLVEKGARSEHATIVHIRSRDHIISVYASPEGPLYKVTDRQGNVLVDAVPAEFLESHHPGLFDDIRAMIAESEIPLYANLDTWCPERRGGLRPVRCHRRKRNPFLLVRLSVSPSDRGACRLRACPVFYFVSAMLVAGILSICCCRR